LEQELMAISDPRSPRYGQHYSREQLARLVGPANREVDAVAAWLTAAGAEDIEFSFAREYCHFRMSIEKVEKLLSVKLMQFQHPELPHTIIRANTPYCIPENLDKAVHMIDGLHFFLAPRYPAAPTIGAAVSLEPDDLYKYYQVSEPTKAVRGSSQAPVQFGGNYFSQDDLQTFEKEYVKAIKGQEVNEVYGTNGNKISVEANLDVQYIIAMGNHVNTSVYIQKCGITSNIETCFITYTEGVLAQNEPPLVQSISYGQYGGNYDNSTVQRLNEDFMKMGTRGISILLASGDNGVGCNSRCTSFEFDFPSSPYITMVGATFFDSNGNENGATLSSGGFSEDYYRPSWQDSAVEGYFNSGVKLPSSSLYYKDGRAYPDVAAAGEKLKIVVNGRNEQVSGTSCSAPIFGGIISLLNNNRLSSGKSSLGFLNPWLYQNPDMFNPISDGNNKYCSSSCCCSGFNGAKGWDPVTGLGSPDFVKMEKAAQ
jgi:tripeptidyl-peptidase-1